MAMRARITGGRHRSSAARGGGRAAFDWSFAGLCAYAVLMLLLGGGAPGRGPAGLLMSTAVILLAGYVAWRGAAVTGSMPTSARAALWGILLLPALQLIPLPPGVWSAAPGQDPRRDVLALTGLAGSWQPLSLEPVGTAYSVVMAAGFSALTAALVGLSGRRFDQLVWVVLAVIGAGIAVGAVQVAAGGVPGFHGVAHHGLLIGFFANKNHMALTLAVSIPLMTSALAADPRHTKSRRYILGGYVALVLVCLVATNSRAGLALGLLATVLAAWDALRRQPGWIRIAALAAAAAIGAAILSSSAFDAVSSRFGEVAGDVRWRAAEFSLPLVGRYWLFGSGAGSFSTVFAANEPLGFVKLTFLNHVHNDYLELAIELGAAGVAVAALFLFSVGRAASGFREAPADVRRRGAMGLTILLLFALHSFVDYPLRRPACAVLFALATAAVYRLGAAVVEAGVVRARAKGLGDVSRAEYRA